MGLLGVLASIALIDSTSIVPISIVPLLAFLAMKRPYLSALAFIAGIFVTTFSVGVLITYGLDQVFAAINVKMQQIWTSPTTADLVTQIVIGVVLATFGFRLAGARQKKKGPDVAGAMSPLRIFLLACGITIVGMPGAVPYLAAIDEILRADRPPGEMVLLLLFYNVIFTAPLLTIVVVRGALGSRSDSFFDRLQAFFDHWGRRLLVVLLIVLGIVLVADGIGFFLGHPLLPVGSPPAD